MNEELKFIHASDFHLDQPMSGLAQIPPHLKESLVNAPYLAATRVFDLAIAERVDFVLLSGDLFDLETAGCRPASFLLSQFERLAEKKIAVYWCGGAVDHPDRWPSVVELPKNVRTFSANIVEEVYHHRSGHPVATILGSGHDPQRQTGSDFSVDSVEIFPIGLAYGEFDTNAITARNIRYWALGGRHQHQVQERGNSLVAFSGSPQSRHPTEVGTHGCCLVRVDKTGQIRTQFVETDAFRWLPQEIEIAENATSEEIENVFSDRALRLINEHPDRQLLVSWRISTTGTFNPKLRNEKICEDRLQWLRKEFGISPTGLWSVSLDIDAPSSLPSGWFQEDTILGDYLRAISRYREDPSIQISLHGYLPAIVEQDATHAIGRLNGEDRDKVLSAATLVGVDYLAAHRDWNDAVASSEQ
ncbi:MAG: metallophosphoesterase [Pirellulaceae bacterium]|nr:metallophosphoesterase [Pirellulaceae bacterium]